MNKIESNSIDLILCDLPYGVTNNKLDIALPFDALWNNYKRICKGAVVLFGQGLFFVDLVNSNRDWYKYDIVWDKVLTSGFLNANIAPLRVHEQIAVFGKGKITYNPQKSRGNINHSKGKQKDCENNNYGKYNFVESNFDGLKYPKSIVTFQKPHPSVALHRTEKPVELLSYLIKTYSNEGETVLDNCMGSGSTGIACLKTNRNFIGIEKDKHYFDIASDRIKKEEKELNRRLF
jgi:site-specific DNA-methyltransferase (adenine-specific)